MQASWKVASSFRSSWRRVIVGDGPRRDLNWGSSILKETRSRESGSAMIPKKRGRRREARNGTSSVSTTEFNWSQKYVQCSIMISDGCGGDVMARLAPQPPQSSASNQLRAKHHYKLTSSMRGLPVRVVVMESKYTVLSTLQSSPVPHPNMYLISLERVMVDN